MRVRRLAFVLSAAIVASGLAATVAFAQTLGGFIGGGGVGAGVDLPGGPGTNNSTISPAGGSVSSTGGGGGGGSSEPATSKWTRHVYGDTSDPGYGTNSPFYCPNGNSGYVDVQTSLADGSELNRVQGCMATPVVGVATPAPPPLPPPPPTAAEARDIVPLPTPGWGVSPIGAGLTGLPTWLWDSNDTTPRTATANIRGYTVVSTASPQQWSWTMSNPGEPGPASRSNPNPVVTASKPGSEASPAATYRYETPGGYTLTLRVTWTGTFTYTRPGLAATTAPLGTTTRTTTRPYTVASISPVLVATGSA